MHLTTEVTPLLTGRMYELAYGDDDDDPAAERAATHSVIRVDLDGPALVRESEFAAGLFCRAAFDWFEQVVRDAVDCPLRKARDLTLAGFHYRTPDGVVFELH